MLKLYPDEKKRKTISQSTGGRGSAKKVQTLRWANLQLVEFMPSPHVTQLLKETFVFGRESGCLELPDNGRGGLGVSLQGDADLPEEDDFGSSDESD